MVVIQCPERADHSEIVRAFADAFEPIPDDQAAFPIRLVACLERHDDLAVSMRWIPADNIGVYFLWIEHRFVGCIVDRFASVLVQLRLDVKAFEMADPATKKNPDDRFGFWREMRFAIGRTPSRRVWFSAGDAISKQNRAQSQASEAHAGIRQKRATCNSGTTMSLKCHKQVATLDAQRD